MVTDIKNVEYIIEFKRDTKVDYQKGNAFINSIFKKFDKNMSGDFDDIEWTVYQKAWEEAQARMQEYREIKNSVAGHYNKKLVKIAREIEKLSKESDKLDFSAWDELLAFEEAHPSISRNGYKDESEVPIGAMRYDISVFGMGIYDEENQRFTGECYENGYLFGLETLTDDEKKQYLTLLDNASKSIKKALKHYEKCEKLDEEYDKYKALGDMANAGMIDRVGSSEYEEQAYQQYFQIRNESNPFYREIKSLEREREALRLKGNQTQDDLRQIEQYNIQINQLIQASELWSIADTGICQKIGDEPKIRLAVSLLNPTYTEEEKTLTNTSSIGVEYNDINWKVDGQASVTQQFSPETVFTSSANAELDVSYQREKIKFNSTSNVELNESMFNFNQNFLLDYKTFNFAVKEKISCTRIAETFGTTNSTTMSLTHSKGEYVNTASATFTESGNTYSLSSSANFKKEFGENSFLTIAPNASVFYNDGTSTTTIAPNVMAMYDYRSNGLNVNATVNENYSATLANGLKPQLNHNFTADASISYKGISGNVSFNDSDSSDSHSNTYGAGVSYQTQKVGTFRFEYSFQRMKDKFSGMISKTNLFSFKYSLPLDWTRKNK